MTPLLLAATPGVDFDPRRGGRFVRFSFAGATADMAEAMAGINWTAIKIGLTGFSPWTFRSLCLGLGGLLLCAVAHLSGQSLRVPRAMWPKLAVLAFFNISSWNMLIAYGLLMIPSGRAAIIAYDEGGLNG